MGNPVVHFEIMGGDGERLKSFYADLFGWKIDSNNPMNYGMVETGGDDGGNVTAGEGDKRSGRAGAMPGPALKGALDKIQTPGGKTVMEPQELPIVSLALFEAPEGNVVGLVKGLPA